MHGYYRLQSSGDFRQDEASIIAVFEDIKSKKLSNDLQLLNYYKEVPINFGTEITLVEPGLAELTVHQLQAIAMKHQNMTLLRSKHFKHDVLAKVLKVGVEKNFAVLTHFAYAQILSDRRKHVRVKLSHSLEASFHAASKSVKGIVNDISLGGVAIRALETCDIQDNQDGRLDMFLNGAKVELPGKILRVHTKEPPIKIVVQMEAEGKNERAISQFVFQTQKEIIRELKDQLI
jgi:hypothetical protein